MKQVSFLLTFLLTTSLCFGQKEHLEPARDFNQYEDLKEYYDNVFPLLSKGFTQKPYARYTSIPSFCCEYAFSVEKIENKNYIISNKLSNGYWHWWRFRYVYYTERRDSIKVSTSMTEINNDLYLKIGELFEHLAAQIRKHENPSMGFDGVSYFFSTTDKNGEIIIGETWSPNKKSLLGKLVKICDNLYLIGIKDKKSHTKVLIEIDKLINDLIKQ